MGADLRTDAVFQRRDDLAASRVVFRVRAEDQGHIQWQTHGIAFDLHVAFLHDVEQSHLDLSREIWQLVDGKDATIGTGQ